MPASRLKTVNVVSSFTYCAHAVDISAPVMPGVYKPKMRTRYVSMRYGTAMLFPTGRAVGFRSPSAAVARRAAHDVIEAVRAAIHDAELDAFSVQSTTSHARCGHSVDLRALAAAYPAQATPRRFGVDFAAATNVIVRVHANGHCVLTATDAAVPHARTHWKAFAGDVLSKFLV